jgi:hypothetical protein
MRFRKNIDCLTTDELHDLREALTGMYALAASHPRSFARLASFHGGPPTTYCRHGAPGFFTWHRAYLLAFEDALRAIRCNVTLPYWDWSSGPSTGVPDACRYPTYVNRSGTVVPNPLYSGPRPAGGQTSRRADIDTTPFNDLATSAQSAMSSASFDSFQSLIDGAHGGVHVRVSGDMGSVPSAAYDPIFYLHHANIDRLWAQWQVAHPGALPASEATFALQPFNRPFSTQWQQGSDVESVDALDYRYRRHCFYFPPIRLWEAVRIKWPPVLREQMASARLVLKSSQMQPEPLEIRAFVDQPDATASTRTIGNPAFAGVVGFIGHALSKKASRAMATRPEGFALDVTGTVSPVATGVRQIAAAGVTVGVTDDVRVLTGLMHEGHTHEGHDHGDHSGGHTNPNVPTPSDGERFDVELDLTAALRRVSRDAEDTALKLVAVNGAGEQVPATSVRFEMIELVVD